MEYMTQKMVELGKAFYEIAVTAAKEASKLNQASARIADQLNFIGKNLYERTIVKAERAFAEALHTTYETSADVKAKEAQDLDLELEAEKKIENLLSRLEENPESRGLDITDANLTMKELKHLLIKLPKLDNLKLFDKKPAQEHLIVRRGEVKDFLKVLDHEVVGKQIVNLDLRATEITEDQLKEILKKYPNVRSVRLGQCENIKPPQNQYCDYWDGGVYVNYKK